MARADAEHRVGATGSASNTKAVNRLHTQRYAADCAGAAERPQRGSGAADRCGRLGGSRQPEALPGQRL